MSAPPPFEVTVLTMFPEAFPGPLGVSLVGTAWREAGLWSLETLDIRGFSKDKRGFLDDTPAGGGPGQVMRADVIASALDSVERRGRPLLYMSARGRPLTQARVKDWADGYEQEFTLTLMATEEDTLVLVEQALERIRARCYGTCEECGGVIAKKRLEAIPFAPTCIRCAEKLENGGFGSGSAGRPRQPR